MARRPKVREVADDVVDPLDALRREVRGHGKMIEKLTDALRDTIVVARAHSDRITNVENAVQAILTFFAKGKTK